jgi:hypothetical protein
MVVVNYIGNLLVTFIVGLKGITFPLVFKFFVGIAI